MDADFVGVGGDDFGTRHVHGVLHQPDFFETDVEHGAHVHDEQDHAGRHDGRQIDVADELQAAGTVHLGGLVQAQVHGRKGCQVDDGHDHHGGDEVRHVSDGLHETLDLLRTDLVDQQGQDDWGEEAQHQRSKADLEGVDHRRCEHRRGEELDEIFESDERTTSQALGWHEITEGQLDAIHRHIREQAHENHRRQNHQPILPIVLEMPAQPLEERP